MPIKFPCTQCCKPCKSNQNSIYCEICRKWTHLKCTNLTKIQFLSLGRSDLPYFCSVCNLNIYLFQGLNNEELIEEFSDHEVKTKTTTDVMQYMRQYTSNAGIHDSYITINNF